MKAGAATHGVAVPPAKVLLAVEERHVVLVWKHALRAGHARTVHGWCSTRLCARAVPRRSETRAPGVGVLSLSALKRPLLSRRVGGGGKTVVLQQQLFSRSWVGGKMVRTQRAVIMLTGYAFYLAVYCPCVRTMSCHLPQFYSSMGLALLLVAWENRKL